MMQAAESSAACTFLQTALRLVAFEPRASGWISNETLWPSFRLRRPAASTADACTKTSLPPPSGAIKPMPLDVLKNSTVPMVIEFPLSSDSERTTCANGRGKKTRTSAWDVLGHFGAPSKRVATTESASSDRDARTTRTYGRLLNQKPQVAWLRRARHEGLLFHSEDEVMLSQWCRPRKAHAAI